MMKLSRIFLVLTGLILLDDFPLEVQAQDKANAAKQPTPNKPSAQEAKALKEREEEKIRGEINTLATFTSQGSLSPIFNVLNDAGVSQQIKLSEEQRRDIEKINDVTRRTLRSMILRDLESANQPREIYQRRAEQTARKTKELIAHAERFVIVGILNDFQAARAKQLYWKSLGVAALLEDEVADRIKLSRDQRKEVATRYKTMRLYEQSPPSGDLAELTDQLRNPDPTVAAAAQAAIQNAHDDVESQVWDVLDPEQVGRFEELLEEKIRRRRK